MLHSLRIGIKNYNLCLIFGRFPAELGPETRSNGPGSKNGAERTQNSTRREILPGALLLDTAGTP